eukprot:5872848-Amphidinium_carterae.1
MQPNLKCHTCSALAELVMIACANEVQDGSLKLLRGSANSRVGSAGGMAASKPSSSAVVSDGSDAFGGRKQVLVDILLGGVSSTQRVVDKQWPASIQIRNGLEENGVEVNKDKFPGRSWYDPHCDIQSPTAAGYILLPKQGPIVMYRGCSTGYK